MPKLNLQQFDINTYRSSWKFVDKNTVRVRFRPHETLLPTVTVTRFLVRHIQTGFTQTYDGPHEFINSTFTLYLHNIKHGRHTVCLLLYTFRFVKTPKYVFCQEIIFNFHKYGHRDGDTDEYGNTFVFLLTQYSIVIGILCILQLVHAGRKRRFLQTVYEKASALRNLMVEYHHRSPENKSTTAEGNSPSNALESLIYNLNRKALYDLDRMYLAPADEPDDVILLNRPPMVSRQRSNFDTHLKLPVRLDGHAESSLHRRSVPAASAQYRPRFAESDSETESDIEQSASFKSVSHILETNKPWMTRLADDGSLKHSIVPSPKPSRPQFHLV